METTHLCIVRGFAKHAQAENLTKTASRRWLEDPDLIKLCNLCKSHYKKKSKKR